MQKRDQYVEQQIQRLDATINNCLKQNGIESCAVLGLEAEYFSVMSEFRAALRCLYEEGWKTGVAEREIARVG